MENADIEIVTYNLETHGRLADYFAVASAMWQERGFITYRSIDDLRIALDNVPSTEKRQLWLAYLSRKPARRCTATFPLTGNVNEVKAHVYVVPSLRGKGIGTALFKKLMDTCKQERRSLVLSYSTATGKDWCRKMGGILSLDAVIFRLDFNGIDFQIIEKELEELTGSSTAVGIITEFHEGSIPAEELPRLVELLNVVSDLAPRGKLPAEPLVTPDGLKEKYRLLVKEGVTFWLLTARDRATGKLAGITEMNWRKNSPETVIQRFTGVLPGYQGKGLGKRLVMEILVRLKERGGVQAVITGMALGNEPMDRINRKLGFRLHVEQYSWQFEVK